MLCPYFVTGSVVSRLHSKKNDVDFNPAMNTARTDCRFSFLIEKNSYLQKKIRIRDTVKQLTREHPEIELSVTYYEDPDEYETQILLAYMSGNADDMYLWTPTAQIMEGGYLADFYEIIDRDPHTEIGDFYARALECLEFNGGLYSFIPSFTYSHAGINTAIPQEFIDEFCQYDAISFRTLVDIYTRADSGQDRRMAVNMNIGKSLGFEFTSFLNMRERLCEFNGDAFKTFVSDAVRIAPVAGSESFDDETIYRYDSQYNLANEYFYFIGSYNVNHCLSEDEQRKFTYFVPVLNDDGKLPIVYRDSFVISQDSMYKELAWEFLNLFIHEETDGAFNRPGSYPVFNIPIQKNIAEEYLQGFFEYDYKSTVHDKLLVYTLGVKAQDDEYTALYEAYWNGTADTVGLAAKVNEILEKPMTIGSLPYSRDLSLLLERLSSGEITGDVLAEGMQEIMQDLMFPDNP